MTALPHPDPTGAAPAAGTAVDVAPAQWIVVARDVCRDYRSRGGVVRALRELSMEVARGEFVAVRGRSGSGKTTLLHILGGLDRPTSGQVYIDGAALTTMPERELIELRRRKIGFVFQSFGLLPILTAAENVEVPLRLTATEPRARERRVHELLDLVGLAARARHRPYELSGGEQQRVSIARALANRPALLLADEPTGQLDLETGHQIMSLLRDVVALEGITAIVTTHDPQMLDVANRVLELHDGELTAS